MQPPACGPVSGMPSDSPNAIELLEHDHKTVLMLFNDFEAMRDAGHDNSHARRRMVQQICLELTIHAQIEEEIFYPAVRQATGDDDRVDEAEDEHAQVKALIEQLDGMRPDEARFDATVLGLSQAVMRHVQEEETELFAEARGHIDAAHVGWQLLRRRQALQQQMGGDAARS